MSKESKELSLDELYKEQRASRNEYYNTDNVELLAQPEQPVAWRIDHQGHGYSFRSYDNGGEPLYTQQKREPLSDGDIAEGFRNNKKALHAESYWAGFKDAEKAHGIGEKK